MTVSPLGDSAVVIALGESLDAAMMSRVQAVAAEIERHPPARVVDVVPAFASVAVYFEPPPTESFEELRGRLEAIVAGVEAAGVTVPARTVEVPVWYGGDAGCDLAAVAANAGLSTETVVALHAGADYLVHAIGFVPGFPYLGGLPVALHTPRRGTPRPTVPVGSVGIGGAQTGIYPLPTPGGWNLIGRTPLVMFEAGRPEPSLLRVGDRVKFRAIPADEYERLSATTGPVHVAMIPRPLAEPGVHVLRAGMFTTVQDLGRSGHRARGVPLSGAADPFALCVANLLVGNHEKAAALEFTLVGPDLKFAHDTIIALTGGQVDELSSWRPHFVRGGTTLKLGQLRTGCRGYLAVAGGIDVAPVLGSRSTYVRAGLGGLAGRALRDDDLLAVSTTNRFFSEHWRIDERILPPYSSSPTIRIVPAAQTSEFEADWTSGDFLVTPHSDRMGVRLSGKALARSTQRELVSSPVVPGTVQVPPDGQPIVLLADAQTIGGYPQVATVVTVDLPLVAQLKPGDRVRFRMVPLDEAHRLVVARDHALALLREGLKEKWS